MAVPTKKPKVHAEPEKQPPININTASATQLTSLPGVGPAIAERIVAARSGRQFTDWVDLKTRVKRISDKTLARIRGSGLAVVQCFDPISRLPGDLAAICLSFLGVGTLLGVAQRVSRAWQAAIDGGLPAVWHAVRGTTGGHLSETQLVEIIRKSHGNAISFSASLATQSLHHVRSFSNLHILDLVDQSAQQLRSLLFPSSREAVAQWMFRCCISAPAVPQDGSV